MDEAATERHDVDHDVLSTREIELDGDGIEAANEAVHEFLHRLDELALPSPTEGSATFTLATLLLEMPGRDG